jgi:hypothetical protein
MTDISEDTLVRTPVELCHKCAWDTETDTEKEREREKLKSKDETNENPIMEWREETLWVFVNKNTDLHKNNKQIRDTREIIIF